MSKEVKKVRFSPTLVTCIGETYERKSDFRIPCRQMYKNMFNISKYRKRYENGEKAVCQDERDWRNQVEEGILK